MRELIGSIEAEYRRYHALGAGAIGQLTDEQLCARGPAGTSSVAVIVWHLSGNFASRFTDFLASDGEKPWRRREEEFAERMVTRAELVEKWDAGWGVLFGALAALADEDLTRTVHIRQQPLRVHEALHRSLAHASYHVGQIVYLAKALRGGEWRWLSIPPGQSDAYNAAPTAERPPAEAAPLAPRPQA